MKTKKEKQLQKPKAKLIGEDGNVFNLLAICKIALRNAGLNDKANELQEKVLSCNSYEKAIAIMNEYVDIV